MHKRKQLYINFSFNGFFLICFSYWTKWDAEVQKIWIFERDIGKMTASFAHCCDFATIPDERVEIFQFFFDVVLFIRSLFMDWIKIEKKTSR